MSRGSKTPDPCSAIGGLETVGIAFRSIGIAFRRDGGLKKAENPPTPSDDVFRHDGGLER